MKDIAFTILIGAEHVNPNGDPVTGRPRIDSEGCGMITSVCIKRKIRNALQQLGYPIFVQAEEFSDDGYTSLQARSENSIAFMKAYKESPEEARKIARDQWIDVKFFGQLLAIKGKSMSLGIRGCVSVPDAYSLDPVLLEETDITRSTNAEEKKGMASDRMGGSKTTIKFGLYRADCAISGVLAEKNGLTEGDMDALREAICNMFIVDLSAARPYGKMYVAEFDWIEPVGEGRSAHSMHTLQSMVKVEKKTAVPKSIDDYSIKIDKLEGVKVSRLVSM